MKRVTIMVSQDFGGEESIYPCYRIMVEGWRIYTNTGFRKSAYRNLGAGK